MTNRLYIAKVSVKSATRTKVHTFSVIYIYILHVLHTGSLELQKVGEQLTLTCSGSEICSVPVTYRNLSNLVYTWYLNNTRTNSNDKNLVIESLSKADNRMRYRCAVREDDSLLPEIESEAVTLDVAYVDGVRLETTESDVSCKSDCYPECSYRWLDDGGRPLSNTSTLNPTKYISGSTVTCEASNGYGLEAIQALVFYDNSRTFLLTVVLSCVLAVVVIITMATLGYICCTRTRHEAEDETQELPIYAMAYEATLTRSAPRKATSDVRQISTNKTGSRYGYNAQEPSTDTTGIIGNQVTESPFSLAAYMRMSGVQEVYVTKS